ncbi:hypothetical protein Afil01_29110 [Actinorhabdospora filicis]|uniref:Protein kinase domain-containing protein n=1 Tax=Actinorhabdospora filicis TaxID=1785913 RepID=A0A9W6SJB4_9ACTN|nr:hypothetical protein [Actinorhabdospora filicis]GLZ78104.1 hypothetical protein Afil01_29110 [Actinorhabdospora filicis]
MKKTIDHDSLNLGERVGQGGQGTVYRVPDLRINTKWTVVYKEYHDGAGGPDVLSTVDVGALTAMVELIEQLPLETGKWLWTRTSWPAHIVHRRGRPSGFLMRTVPGRFHFRLKSRSDPRGTRRLANAEFLLNEDSYTTSIGLRAGDRDRLLLLADLARTLSRLHSLNIAVGDLSPKNLLFCLAPRHECFLIDCDAMSLRGRTVLPQAETPDWQVPAGEEKGTRRSDAYKFALLAIRLLARDQTTTDPARLAGIDAKLGSLARAGLAAHPGTRPALESWIRPLELAALAAPVSPPTRAAPPPAKTATVSSTAPSVPTSTTSPSPSPSINWDQVWGWVAAIVAVIAVVYWINKSNDHAPSTPKAPPVAERPAAAPPKDDPYVPPADDNAGCAEATASINRYFDAAEDDLDNGDLAATATDFRNLASALTRNSVLATDSSVYSAILALSSDSTYIASIVEWGDSGSVSAAFGYFESDLAALRDACS